MGNLACIYTDTADSKRFRLFRLLSNINLERCSLYSLQRTCKQGCGVGVGGVACFHLESESGVGVGFQNCWSRSRFFKTAGVGVGSRSRFFKTAGVGVGSRSQNICCNYRLQCLINNLNYNINCLKIITGFWQY